MTRTGEPSTSIATPDVERLIGEHHTLMRHYGKAQIRCSEQLQAQAGEIARLRTQAMRLRAAVITRETALAWAREDRAALEDAIPGLPRRVTLARRVDALLARVQDLMRERLRWQRRETPPQPVASAARRMPEQHLAEPGSELGSLEASLVAADLVICQTGCLSHGAYWRVQDHCRRTGKTCVLVRQPEALRIVHIHDGHDAPGAGSPG